MEEGTTPSPRLTQELVETTRRNSAFHKWLNEIDGYPIPDVTLLPERALKASIFLIPQFNWMRKIIGIEFVSGKVLLLSWRICSGTVGLVCCFFHKKISCCLCEFKSHHCWPELNSTVLASWACTLHIPDPGQHFILFPICFSFCSIQCMSHSIEQH